MDCLSIVQHDQLPMMGITDNRTAGAGDQPDWYDDFQWYPRFVESTERDWAVRIGTESVFANPRLQKTLLYRQYSKH
jgi:hypothetical protein